MIKTFESEWGKEYTGSRGLKKNNGERDMGKIDEVRLGFETAYKDKAEYEVAKKFGFCLNCQEKNCIQEVNQLEEIMKEQIAKWKSESLPDIEIDILRVLYNNRQHEMSAVEIGNEVDRHHLAITKIMEKLSKRGYVSYVTRDKRYYSIKEKAISIFFNDVMETVENENS